MDIKDINEGTTVEAYGTLVLSALLHNSETWTVKEAQKNRPKVFEMTFLYEGVTRRDMKRNEEIREGVGCCQEIDRRLMKRRLKYFGHMN